MLEQKSKHCVNSLAQVVISVCLFMNLPLHVKGAENDFIMHHVQDAHTWHFATIGNCNISAPLPIILYNKKGGLEIFSSRHFRDQNNQIVNYKGYTLNAHDKIIALDGHDFYDISITKNVTSMFISMVILLVAVLMVGKSYKRNGAQIAPKGWQAFFDLIICTIKDEIAIPNIGKKHYERFMPYY